MIQTGSIYLIESMMSLLQSMPWSKNKHSRGEVEACLACGLMLLSLCFLVFRMCPDPRPQNPGAEDTLKQYSAGQEVKWLKRAKELRAWPEDCSSVILPTAGWRQVQ
jgi:hypothetical protein